MIGEAVARLGPGPLTEDALVAHVHPLFSQVLRRPRIYLANHSLGRPPDQTADDVAAAMRLWYAQLGGAWDEWLAEIGRFRAATARLVGTHADCIVPRNGAGQGLRAVLNSYDAGIDVVTTRGEFDSIDFILKHYRARGRITLGFVEPDADGLFHSEAIVRALDERCRADGGSQRLLVLSQVMFASGQLVPNLGAIVEFAHGRGARVLLDVYHAAGVLPVDLAALDVDFAVGGSYKYLRGGPGACWLYVHPRLLERGLLTLDTGWFAQRNRFGYHRSEQPEFAPGGDAWLESTPPVLSAFQARAGLEFALAIGVDRLRTYSLAQQRILLAELSARGITATGGDALHGAFVVLRHPHAAELADGLRRAGIDTDARGTCLRLCPDVLNTQEELVMAAERLAALVAAGFRQADC